MKNSFALPTIYVIGFFEFASQSLLVPVMPFYAAKLGASLSEIGVIVALLAYGTAFFMIPFGLLSDRLGRRTVIIAGLTISTLACLLYPLATTVVQLSLLRAIHGIGLAAQIPSTLTALLDLSPGNQMGKTVGWYTSVTQSALMVGPVIGGYLLNQFGFETPFISSGILSLAGLAIILLRIQVIPPRKIAEPSIKKSWGWLKQKTLYGALLTSFIMAVGLGTLGTYIPIYGNGFGISAVGAGLIITLCYGSSAMMRAIAGSVSDKIGRKPIILAGLVAGTVTIALISCFHSLVLLCITSFCFGISLGIVLPASIAQTNDLSSKESRGLAIGICTSSFQIGYAVGPTAMGVVAQMSSLETMFIACGVSLAIGSLIVYILFRTKRSLLNPI